MRNKNILIQSLNIIESEILESKQEFKNFLDFILLRPK
uniref:Uncharacterized protein n=1 Tax=viral metagenome TaxID=1070528 RepID=A0A6C0AFD0_9ZZZZ